MYPNYYTGVPLDSKSQGSFQLNYTPNFKKISTLQLKSWESFEKKNAGIKTRTAGSNGTLVFFKYLCFLVFYCALLQYRLYNNTCMTLILFIRRTTAIWSTCTHVNMNCWRAGNVCELLGRSPVLRHGNVSLVPQCDPHLRQVQHVQAWVAAVLF